MLRDFLDRHPRLFVLTGAGCSTDSGIPDYRDLNGEWKPGIRPVSFQAFMGAEPTRKRYWARSLVGWRRFRGALPNEAHRALAQLERQERIRLLVTQNVDRLHQRAGSTNVIDLHGRLDQVRCMQCERRSPRELMQERLGELNPDWKLLEANNAPDGDSDLEALDFSSFVVPECEVCGGVVKPDVVFFGESVPALEVASAMQALEEADAVLVIGSSLMVYSGYRFVHAAALEGKPIAAVNLGQTRADDLFSLKVSQPCCEALAFLLN